LQEAGQTRRRRSPLEDSFYESMSIPTIDIPIGTTDAITSDDILEGSLLADIVNSERNGNLVYESSKNNYFLFSTIKDLYVNSYPNPFTKYPIERDDIRIYRAHLINVQGGRRRPVKRRTNQRR
jgi:hypothetical protein